MTSQLLSACDKTMGHVSIVPSFPGTLQTCPTNVPQALTPRRVLMLYWWNNQYQIMRPAIRQHLRFLTASKNRHQVLYHNIENGVPGFLRRTRFDVIILHTTLLCIRW